MMSIPFFSRFLTKFLLKKRASKLDNCCTITGICANKRTNFIQYKEINIFKLVHAQYLKEMRNTCVPFDFNSQNDGGSFWYYQFYCRIQRVCEWEETLTTKRSCVHWWLLLNAFSRLWSTKMDVVWKKQHSTPIMVLNWTEESTQH